MVKSVESIELLMPAWTKKHGYIKWHIKDDNAIRQFFGGKTTLVLSIKGSLSKKRTVEHKYRRIGIGYSITRSLADDIKKVILTKTQGNDIKVDFK